MWLFGLGDNRHAGSVAGGAERYREPNTAAPARHHEDFAAERPLHDYYAPLNVAVRRSVKAATPSRASAVSASATLPRSSRASPSDSGPSSPRSTHRLISRTARGGRAANSAARSRAR